MAEAVPPSRFDLLLGTEWLEDEPERARVRLPVRDELRQPFGLVHGGVFSSLVESICSRATHYAVRDQGLAAVGQQLAINFMRRMTEGTVEGTGTARHRGPPSR